MYGQGLHCPYENPQVFPSRQVQANPLSGSLGQLSIVVQVPDEPEPEPEPEPGVVLREEFKSVEQAPQSTPNSIWTAYSCLGATQCGIVHGAARLRRSPLVDAGVAKGAAARSATAGYGAATGDTRAGEGGEIAGEKGADADWTELGCDLMDEKNWEEIKGQHLKGQSALLLWLNRAEDGWEIGI